MTHFLLILSIIFVNVHSGAERFCDYDSNNELPVALAGHLMIKHSTNVYIFGGVKDGGTASTKIYKWDTTQTNGWFVALANINTPGSYFYSNVSSVVVINDKIYFVGIYTDATVWGKIHVFDPLSEQWSTLKAAKYNAYGGCVTTDNTHIYMVGGTLSHDTGTLLNYTQIYSIDDNTWHEEEITLSPISSGYSNQRCEIIDNKLYAFGGSIGTGIDWYPSIKTSRMYIYTPSDSKWIKKQYSETNKKSSYGNSVIYNNKIFLMAGEDRNSLIKKVDLFDPFDNSINYRLISDEFKLKDKLKAASSLVINDKIYIFGGIKDDEYGQKSYSKKVEICNPLWRALKILNCEGSSNTEFRTKVIDVPIDSSIDHVKMMEHQNNAWISSTYDSVTDCYIFNSGITPYLPPLGAQIKVDGIEIEKQDMTYYSQGFQRDLDKNVAAPNGYPVELKIVNCPDSNKNEYRAKVLNIYTQIYSIEYFKIRDDTNHQLQNDNWILGVLDSNSGCYVFSSPNTDLIKPLDIKIKVNTGSRIYKIVQDRIMWGFDEKGWSFLGKSRSQTYSLISNSAATIVSNYKQKNAPFKISIFEICLFIGCIIIIVCIIGCFGIYCIKRKKYIQTTENINVTTKETTKETEGKNDEAIQTEIVEINIR